MVSPDEPAKQLLPFLQRADELQKHDALVAYYCRLYAMDKGLNIPQKERTKDTNALLVSLINQLEKDKKVVKTSGEDGLYLEGFAQNVFAKADKIDRSGRADLNTAKTFYAASIFFEVLRQFGELQPDLEQKQKYAIWKAADIRKAIAEGRKPIPGPPGGDPLEAGIDAELEAMTNGAASGNLSMDQGSGPLSSSLGLSGYPTGAASAPPPPRPATPSSDDIDLPSAPSAPPRLHQTRSFSQPDAPPDSGNFSTKAVYPPGYGPGSTGPPPGQSQNYSQPPPVQLPTGPPYGSSFGGDPNMPPPSAAFLAGSMAGYPTGAASRPPPEAAPPPMSGYPTGASSRPTPQGGAPPSYPYSSQTYPSSQPSHQYGGPGNPSAPPSSYPGPGQSYPSPGGTSGYPSASHPPPAQPPSSGYADLGMRGYGSAGGNPSPSHINPPSSSPSPSLGPSAPQPHKQATQPSSSGLPSSTVGPVSGNDPPLLDDSDFQPSADKIADAHKAARFAVSALAFDDVPTAVAYLRQSLQLLQAPSRSS